MNLELVRTFLEVMKTGSLAKAADKLHVTASTVTMRLNALEEHLRQQLIVRNRAGAVLTPAGFAFKRYAEILDQTWHQAEQSIALPHGFSATVSIGFEYDLWDGAVEEILGCLRTHHADIALSFWAGKRDDLDAWLSSGLIDLALFVADSRSGVGANDHVFTDRLILVSRENREPEHWHPQYVYVDWGEKFRRDHALAYPINETPVLTFGEGRMALQHIQDEGGSGYFPVRVVRKHLERGTLHPVRESPEFELPVCMQISRMTNQGDWYHSTVAKLREIDSQTATFIF